MKKKKNNNTGVIIITIIIIILGLLGAYLWENSSSTNQNTTNKEGVAIFKAILISRSIDNLEVEDNKKQKIKEKLVIMDIEDYTMEKQKKI